MIQSHTINRLLYGIPPVTTPGLKFAAKAQPNRTSYYQQPQQDTLPDSSFSDKISLFDLVKHQHHPASIVPTLALNYFQRTASDAKQLETDAQTKTTANTTPRSLFLELYHLIDHFDYDNKLSMLISNFEFFSNFYSEHVGLNILEACLKNKNDLSSFDFELFETFFRMMCSGLFKERQIEYFANLSKKAPVHSDYFQSELKSFYASHNAMAWFCETHNQLQEIHEAILSHADISFKTKSVLFEACQKRAQNGASDQDVLHFLQVIEDAVHNKLINNDDVYQYTKNICKIKYTLHDFKVDLNFFGLFRTAANSPIKGITQTYTSFKTNKFQMTSRFSRGRSVFSLDLAQLSPKSRKALFLLEYAFGNIEKLSLSRLLFGNQSFNHKLLNENEKRDLIIELLSTLSDYIEHKQFSSVEEFIDDPLIMHWFDPNYEGEQTYHEKTYRSNSLVRAKLNSAGIPLTSLGFQKEFRGQVWASLNFEKFIPFPDESTDPFLKRVFSGYHKIDPDGLYYMQIEDLEAPVLFEVKSFNQGDNTIPFENLNQFAPITRQDKHGTLRFQFGKMAHHLLHNPDLHLHYHLITDVQTVSTENKPIDNTTREAAFRKLLKSYLKRNLKFSIADVEDVMARTFITFDKYLKS